MADQSDRRSVERRQLERRSGRGLDFSELAQLGELAEGGAEIMGYQVEAADGPIGHVEDFCVEEESSVVTGFLAAPDPTSKRIFVPLSAVERIDQRAKRIYARLGRDELIRGSRKTSRPEE